MVHTVRIPRRRGGKRAYLVHFFASAEFDLSGFIEELKQKHDLTVLTKKRQDMESILIRLTPRTLRRILETVPRSVQVAYEERESETC